MKSTSARAITAIVSRIGKKSTSGSAFTKRQRMIRNVFTGALLRKVGAKPYRPPHLQPARRPNHFEASRQLGALRLRGLSPNGPFTHGRFGGVEQPDSLIAIRAWTADLFDALFRQDEFIDSGAIRQLEVPVSIIFGMADRYLTPTLAAEIAGLFREPSLHLVQNASHWPQWDQPETVAELITKATENG